MKLDTWLEEFNRIDESGIRNMRSLAKSHSKAVIYMHIDGDGIVSAISLKHILENEYKLKVIDAIPIQYGAQQWAVKKIKDPDTLVCMVDFAQGKPFLHIWTDHHSGEKTGVPSQASTSFISAPANAYHISTQMSKRQVFLDRDMEIINTVDSADFYKKGLTPDDIMRAAFGLDKTISVKDNHFRMGLVVNKLLLSYKNKPEFLKKLVMNSKPSLISMYNVIRRIAKQEGYNPPEKVEKEQQAYISQQKENIKEFSSAKDVETMKNGESAMLDDVVVQYGGGKMGKGVQFDRYTVFKNHPDANYLVMMWPMGLIQVSANPFKNKNTTVNFRDVVMDSLEKYETQFKNKMITIEELKRKFEDLVTKHKIDQAVGFTFDDLIQQFTRDQIIGLDIEKSGKWKDIVKDIINKKYKDLSPKQKNILKKVKVSFWNVVMSMWGGHDYGIVNLPGFEFLGKGYPDNYMKPIASEIVKKINKIDK